MLRALAQPLISVFQWPLYLRILMGVVVGAAMGAIFRNEPILFGWTNSDSGVVAGFYVQVLTAMATPLIFFAIVDAFVRTNITGGQGLKMFVICATNIAAAFLIGLTIINVWHPGEAWSETLKAAESRAEMSAGTAAPALPATPRDVSLAPLDILRSFVPKSIAQPFLENMVLTVAVLAMLIGAARRKLTRTDDPELAAALTSFDHVIIALYQIVLRLLLWMIELAPFAICLSVAGVIGTTGLKTFAVVGVFMATIMAGLGFHSLVYYPLSVWLMAGLSPRRFFREGGGAILTGLSLNSSLATAPLTLEALARLGVSDSSARLSACVGTNFNNDGVTLYEAMTALFIAQALGLDLSLGHQITILLAALVGSMGIAGIPNSGLIILALVLKAARLPDAAIQLAIPIAYSIDFVLARLRSAVNVMGDLQVAILLDVAHRGEIGDSAESAA
ncbi:C4-dicarboxylate transport protein [Caulifigura coniformis]|uniref:C4-dicarboxylate transport protein n=1 Tax=Caulifigura coniformis TaxID=2527983 RepID=A0A517SDN1_9PLAN|nr:dicarboxylate/amino acid:cation symporter [Caulifigura coniformis]QDT54229.1 C4-dicarboxylate transport protein [Caulifigura coniformis]